MLNKNVFFDEYKRKRRKWIIISFCAAIVLTLISVALLALFFKLRGSTSVSYKESGNAYYTVSLKENEFYSDDDVGKRDAYVAALIDKINVEFVYDLDVNARKAQGRYSYSVDAYLEIKDNKTGSVMLKEKHELVSTKTGEIKGGILDLSQSVSTNYSQYDTVAREFVSRYALIDTESTLVLRMSVYVPEMSGSFKWNDVGAYEIDLRIPLCQSTVRPEVETTVLSESRVIGESSSAAGAVLAFAILFIVLDVAAVSLAISFVTLTNEKSEYEKKMRRLRADYKGYIKKVRNEFDTSGYKIIFMDSLDDLIDMRECEHSSVLLYESENGEYSRFFILMPPNVMYAFDMSSDGSRDGAPRSTAYWNYDDEKGGGDSLKIRLMRFLNN